MITREYTKKMLEALEEGLFNKDQLIQDLLSWMSERDVKEFCEAYELLDFQPSYEDPDEGRDWLGEWYDTSMELA